jgi:glycerol-3-phosphate acyltransferase PlsY
VGVAVRTGVFLELAKFVSLLLSILSLDAVLHSAFLEPGSHLEQRLLPSLDMLLVAAAVSLGSGYIFSVWDQKTGKHNASVVGSLPMMIFWWGAGIMAVLYALAWLWERYCLELWH